MARRRTRKKTTTRRRRSFNLVNAAELYVQTSILTAGMFNVNPIQFLTGRTAVHAGIAPIGAPSYFPNTGDSVITLPELLGVDYTTSRQGSQGPSMTSTKSFTADPSKALATITANAKANLIPMVVQTVGTKIFFNVLKKATTKQRSMLNKGFKAVGVREVRV